MITFQSLSYYLYVIMSFLLYHWLASYRPNYRKYALLAINVLFLTLLFYFRKKHLGLTTLFILFNYLSLILLYRCSKAKIKKILAFSQITFSILFLSFFKYELFQIPILAIFPQLNYFLKPLVFIGISFLTFKLISVVVDVLREEIEEPIDFFHLTNFLIFFPCFLSGPLDRYNNFVSNFGQAYNFDWEEKYRHLYRITLGAFKKIVLADTLYQLSLYSIHRSEIPDMSLPQIMLAQYIYSLVLYFDFAGYSDIAIGVSGLFGIKTPENFNNPFFARNIQDFWNKWHIGLMHWLRDYIFYPIQKTLLNLGLSNFVMIASIAFLFTFFVAGIWHGDTLYYAMYGISHGLAFSVYLIYKRTLEKILTSEGLDWYKKSLLIRVLATLITYHYFVFSLFFFLNKYNALQVFWSKIYGP